MSDAELQAERDRAFVTACVEACRRGFDNEHHWGAWLKKWGGRIDKLPQPLKRRVLEAHANSGPKEIR